MLAALRGSRRIGASPSLTHEGPQLNVHARASGRWKYPYTRWESTGLDCWAAAAPDFGQLYKISVREMLRREESYCKSNFNAVQMMAFVFSVANLRTIELFFIANALHFQAKCNDPWYTVDCPSYVSSINFASKNLMLRSFTQRLACLMCYSEFANVTESNDMIGLSLQGCARTHQLSSGEFSHAYSVTFNLQNCWWAGVVRLYGCASFITWIW